MECINQSIAIDPFTRWDTQAQCHETTIQQQPRTNRPYCGVRVTQTATSPSPTRKGTRHKVVVKKLITTLAITLFLYFILHLGGTNDEMFLFIADAFAVKGIARASIGDWVPHLSIL